jgi:hypothetical protein
MYEAFKNSLVKVDKVSFEGRLPTPNFFVNKFTPTHPQLPPAESPVHGPPTANT